MYRSLSGLDSSVTLLSPACINHEVRNPVPKCKMVSVSLSSCLHICSHLLCVPWIFYLEDFELSKTQNNQLDLAFLAGNQLLVCLFG